MAVRRPIVLVDGKLTELPLGDTLPEESTVPTVGETVVSGYDTADGVTSDARDTQTSTAIVVFVAWQDNGTIPTVADNKGNTYGAPVLDLVPSGGSFSTYLAAWFLPNAIGGTGHTFSAALTGGYPSIFAAEVPGAAAALVNGGISGATPFNSGDVSPASDALLIGFSSYEGVTTSSSTVSAGFTKLEEITDPAFWQGVMASRTVPAGTHDFEVAVTGVSDGGAILLALTGSAPVIPAVEAPWTRITGATTAEAGGKYLAVISSATDLTLPALEVGDAFVVANSGDSTADLRVVVGGSVTINRPEFVAGDNLLLAPGDTVHLVAESTTELDIV